MAQALRRALGASACFLVAFLSVRPASAIDVDPGDYTTVPAGTTLAVGYYQYATRGKLDVRGVGNVPDSRLDSQVGIARFVHYTDVFGVRVAPQILLPFGGLYNAQAGGQTLPSVGGLFDPILALPIWALNQPGQRRWLGIAPYLSLPIGSYGRDRPLNPGNGRWTGILQVGFVQGIDENWSFDLTVDTTFYGDDSRSGRARQRLSQSNSYQVQPWIRYRISPSSEVALGYSGTFGGFQKLDGISNGAATIAHTVRLSYSQFLSPTWQLSGRIGRDISVSGGFRQDFFLQARLLKVF